MSGPLSARIHRVASFAGSCIRPSVAGGFLYSWIVGPRLRSCGHGLRLRLTTTIQGHDRIVIGKNFWSMGRLYLYANEGGSIEIGDDCTVNTNVQIGAASGKIVLGNSVMIGPNVVLRAANHGMRRDTPMRHQPSTPGEIVIEDDVWIGSNAVITANLKIARGTVVGAGSVVTSSTEPYSIVGGVPARKIGERS
jgi:galactoside O-acetyltransferase